MIVVLEGGDASGKSTISAWLAAKLKATHLWFPAYETETGRAIRGHLRGDWQAIRKAGVVPIGKDVDALVFQCLQLADKLGSVPLIREHQASGKHLVIERYWPSAWVYGGVDDIDRDWLLRIHETTMPQADLYLLLDIAADESFRRRPIRRDPVEADREHLEKVLAGYRELWAAQYKVDPVRWWRLMSDRLTLEQTQELIWSSVKRLLPGQLE